MTFTSDRAGPSFDLWTKRADGSGEPVLELDQWALAEALWSPDGNWFLHRTFTDVQGAGDILGRRKGRDTTLVPIVATRFTELAPALSPNGRWLACSSTETGRNEVIRRAVPERWRFEMAGVGRWRHGTFVVA